MTEKQLKNINEYIVKQISYYKQNDKILSEIIINNDLYGSKKIDIIKDTILQHNCNFQKIKLELLEHQKLLMSENIKNDFLDNTFTLELIINKFWLRFYSRFYRDQKEINKYWKNEYLDCYKRQFFLKKNLAKNSNNLSKNDINEINKGAKNNLILSSSASSTNTNKFIM